MKKQKALNAKKQTKAKAVEKTNRVDDPEIRLCNRCAFEWVDTGNYTCPECGSMDTFSKFGRD
jgi:hypothetical protein